MPPKRSKLYHMSSMNNLVQQFYESDHIQVLFYLPSLLSVSICVNLNVGHSKKLFLACILLTKVTLKIIPIFFRD